MRPKKPESDHRTYRISFVETKDERAQLEALMKRSGYRGSVHKFARDIVRRHVAGGGSISPEATAAFTGQGALPANSNDVLIWHLEKIGTNLNQIARKLNATGRVVPDEHRQVLAKLDDIATELRRA